MRACVTVCIFLLTMNASHAVDWSRPLAELLGYEATDRLLIINADDFGMSQSTNQAIFDAFQRGVLTAATVMMPTAWVKEVALWAQEHPEADIGLHLTHTSEWRRYRWAPVAGRGAVPGLLAPDGYMWPRIQDVWEHATPEEADIEARAQIDLAHRMGLDPTHLDSHMGTLQLHEDFWKVYLQLSVDYQLPQRQGSRELYTLAGAAGRKDAEKAAGVAGPDHLVFGLPEPQDVEQIPAFYEHILRHLRPGITELYLHPAIDTPELRAITGNYARRDMDYRWLVDPRTRELVEELGIKLIGYRPLRDLMRSEAGGQ